MEEKVPWLGSFVLTIWIESQHSNSKSSLRVRRLDHPFSFMFRLAYGATTKYFWCDMVTCLGSLSFACKVYSFQLYLVHQNLEQRWIWRKHHFQGVEARMAQQSLVSPSQVANRTSPQWLLLNLSADELQSCPWPDAICILRSMHLAFQVECRKAIKVRLYTLCAGMCMCISLKSNIVMTHDQSNNRHEQLNSILDWTRTCIAILTCAVLSWLQWLQLEWWGPTINVKLRYPSVSLAKV